MSTQPEATLETVIAALEAKGARELAEWIAPLIVKLGAKHEWSMDDNFETTETVASFAGSIDLPEAGDQSEDALRFWVAIAEAEGWDHDVLDWCAECGDEDGPFVRIGEIEMCVNCHLELLAANDEN